MSKYIIKNCDAFCPVEHSKGLMAPIKNTCINYKLPQITKCADISDCLLKRIVGLCKWAFERSNDTLAQTILLSLDIQEILK